MSASKPTVLFVMHLPPPVHGAAMVGQFIQDSHLIQEAVHAHTINLSSSTTLEEIGQGGLKKLWTILKLYGKVWKVLRRLQPDLCYITLTATGVGFYKDCVIAGMAKLTGTPVLYHFHNKGIQEASKKSLDSRLYAWVFKKAKVLLLSPYLTPDLANFVTEDQLEICPNGIPDPLGKRPLPRQVQGETLSLVFLSNLIESKGILLLLEALALLNNPKISLDIVGAEADVSAERLTERMQALGIASQVTYHGKKYGQEKFDILQRCDAFVFPSYYPNECFPLSLLEAMSLGLPIISTFEGAIPHVVRNGDNGLLVPQRDVTALAAAIKELLENPYKRKDMGEKSREYFENEFTLQIFEKNFCEILLRTVNSDK